MGAPGTHLPVGLLALHHHCALSAAWHLCVSINHVQVDQDFTLKAVFAWGLVSGSSSREWEGKCALQWSQSEGP